MLVRAAAFKVAAFTVPVLASLTLLAVVGAVLPRSLGLMLLPGVPVAASLVLHPAGERFALRVVWRARLPTRFQQVTLTPVVEVLHRHRVDTGGLTLRVAPCAGVDAAGIGECTVLMSTGFIEAVVDRRLPPQQAGACIAHEIGVLRSGLVNRDVALLALTAPLVGLPGRPAPGPAGHHRGRLRPGADETADGPTRRGLCIVNRRRRRPQPPPRRERPGPGLGRPGSGSVLATSPRPSR